MERTDEPRYNDNDIAYAIVEFDTDDIPVVQPDGSHCLEAVVHLAPALERCAELARNATSGHEYRPYQMAWANA